MGTFLPVESELSCVSKVCNNLHSIWIHLNSFCVTAMHEKIALFQQLNIDVHRNKSIQYGLNESKEPNMIYIQKKCPVR